MITHCLIFFYVRLFLLSDNIFFWEIISGVINCFDFWFPGVRIEPKFSSGCLSMVELEGMILHNKNLMFFHEFLRNSIYEFSKLSPIMVVELEGMILSNNKYFMYFDAILLKGFRINFHIFLQPCWN